MGSRRGWGSGGRDEIRNATSVRRFPSEQVRSPPPSLGDPSQVGVYAGETITPYLAEAKQGACHLNIRIEPSLGWNGCMHLEPLLAVDLEGDCEDEGAQCDDEGVQK